MAGIVQATPLVGHVHLVLYEHEPHNFYLEILIAIIDTLCLKPRKYLRYLDWCVLGALGTLRDAEMNDVDLDGNLAVYHYNLPQDQGFSFAFHYEI
jgi:hypothetical protein